MIIVILAGLVTLFWCWRKVRKARQRQSAVVSAAPMVQALAGAPVRRNPPSRWRGSHGAM